MSEKTLLDNWIILYRRKKAILVVILISFITSIIISKMLTPIYEAVAVCEVPSKSNSRAFIFESEGGTVSRDLMIPSPDEDAAAPFVGILKSSRIAELVNKEFPKKSIFKLKWSDIDIELTDEYMLKIFSRDQDPVLAADVANAYMKYLNMILQEGSLKNTEQDLLLIKRQINETNQKLIDAKEELKEFEAKNTIISMDEEIKNLSAQKSLFQNRLEDSKILIEKNNKMIKSRKEQIEKENVLISGQKFMLSNPLIEYLKQKIADTSARISAGSAELKENHPEIIKLKNEYKELSDRLNLEIQNLISSQIRKDTFYEQMRQDLVNAIIENNGLEASARENAEAIHRINERLIKISSSKNEWQKINDSIDSNKRILEKLNLNQEESLMQQLRQIQYVVTVDTAKPPTFPSFPLWWLNGLLALLGGLAAGVFYAFLLNYIEESRGIKTKKIIKELLSEE